MSKYTVKYFRTKITAMAVIIVLLWTAILFAATPAKAHDIPQSNFYQCGNNEVIITDRYVIIRGWKMDIVDNRKFKSDFKRKNQATFQGHLIMISFNVGSTLNPADYYIIDRANLTYTRSRAGKNTTGPCLLFKH